MISHSTSTAYHTTTNRVRDIIIYLKKYNYKIIVKKHYAPMLFVFSNSVASTLAFVISAYLGRTLTYENFALINLLGGFISITSIVFGSLGTTLNYKLNNIVGKYGDSISEQYWKLIRNKAFYISIIISCIWVLSSSFLTSYFNLANPLPILLFTPILLFSIPAAADKGLLFSKLNFVALSAIALILPLTKLFISFIFVILNQQKNVYMSITLSFLSAYLVGYLFIYKYFSAQVKKATLSKLDTLFPKSFFASSLANSISTIIFLNYDVILANHYLSKYDAGVYSLTAVISKMIFFFSTLTTPFTIPLVSRLDGSNKSTKHVLYLTILASLIATIPVYIAITYLKDPIVTILFGSKAVATFPYILPLATGMLCFSTAKIFTDYYLAKQRYVFSFVSLVIGLVQILLLERLHGSLAIFSSVISSIWVTYLVLTITIHLFSNQLMKLEKLLFTFIKRVFNKSNVDTNFNMNNKMNIAILDFDDIDNHLLGAGQAHSTYEVAKRLVMRGYTVTVYCSKYPNYKDRVENGIRYKHIGITTNNIKINNLIYFLFVPFTVIQVKADLIIECFTAPISTLFSPLFTSIPVIVLPSMFNAKAFSQKYKIPFELIEKFGMRFYKYMMPYSDTDSSKALRLNPNINYKIIPQGVGQEYLDITPSKSPKHILFLSRFDVEQKGIDLLLKAYAKIKNQVDLPLVIAGHGPDKQIIQNMIESLNLKENVKIIGSAYGDKKAKLMSEALFTAFPSRHDEMCLWTLESFAAGLPVVCFDIPESKWFDTSVSIKVKPYDIDEYASALVKASDRKDIQSYKYNAKEFATTFSWEKVVDEYEKYFEYVLKIESEYDPDRKNQIVANI